MNKTVEYFHSTNNILVLLYQNKLYFVWTVDVLAPKDKCTFCIYTTIINYNE